MNEAYKGKYTGQQIDNLLDKVSLWLKGGDSENGATFYPYVDAEGNISWENDKNLANPPSVNIIGPQGPQGIPGPKVSVLGTYNSVEELYAAHPIGSIGDSYLVNEDLYIWSFNETSWYNAGKIQGPQGPKGETGPQGPEGPQGPPGDSAGGSGVYIGPEPPEDEDINYWLDTDEEDDSESFLTKAESDARYHPLNSPAPIDMDLLWENASPGSAFAAQTVPIDTDNYLLYLIYVKVDAAANTNRAMPVIVNKLNDTVCLWVDVGSTTQTRDVVIGDSYIEFKVGKKSGDNNSVIIPTRIYGIK